MQGSPSGFDSLLHEGIAQSLFNTLLHTQNFGIVVFAQRILFCNGYAKQLSGYSDDDIYNMGIIDFLHPEDREIVANNIERRLRGEVFKSQAAVRLQRKDGSIAFIEYYADTLLIKDTNLGIAFFQDITQRRYTEKAKDILKIVNRTTTESILEEEIYNNICRALVEKLGLVFAWVGIYDGKDQSILPLYKYGEDRGLFEALDYNIGPQYEITYTALTSRQVVINPDTRGYAEKSPIGKELLKRNFLSTCTIPLLKFGELVSCIKLYSEIPGVFNETLGDIFKEIQHDVSFALERCEDLREAMILSEALRNSDTWVLFTDEKGEILYVNNAVERISGYSKKELLGQNPRIFKSDFNPIEFYREMWNTLLSGKIYNAVIPNRKKSGEIFYADLKIIPVKLPGNVTRFVAVGKDVTSELALSARLRRIENFDSLTGLLNLNSFITEVSVRLNKIQGLGLFILMDLYYFTYINKIYGLEIGDRVLQRFALELKKRFPKTNTIARLAADTFGIFLEVETSRDIYHVYSRVYDLNNTLFDIEGNRISMNINGAIASFPKDGKDFKMLYERADITLQSAKKRGAQIVQFFDQELEKQTEDVWTIMNLIKKSLDNNHFTFFYQPYFHNDASKIAGCEALVRIIDETGKLYTPKVFIDYLEKSHYLEEFEQWAIEEVIKMIRQWGINVSLNISGKTFQNPTFKTIIAAIPKELMKRLTIEITERVFMHNTDSVIENLASIKSLPVPPKIALDDFGTGYSSIISLRDLPIDVIKIDRIFIKDMIEDKKNYALVKSIIDLANRLDKITLAEGVETEEQFRLLKDMGCNHFQGFYFAKPLPEEQLINQRYLFCPLDK